MSFTSRVFGNTRSVRVLVPAGYDAPAQRTRRYPALYLNDGQHGRARRAFRTGIATQASDGVAQAGVQQTSNPVFSSYFQQRTDLDEFVACYRPENRHERTATWHDLAPAINGETPLIRAVQMHNVDIVRQLLDAKADPDRADYGSGKSARDYAREGTRWPAIAKLVADAPKKGQKPASGPGAN